MEVQGGLSIYCTIGKRPGYGWRIWDWVSGYRCMDGRHRRDYRITGRWGPALGIGAHRIRSRTAPSLYSLQLELSTLVSQLLAAHACNGCHAIILNHEILPYLPFLSRIPCAAASGSLYKVWTRSHLDSNDNMVLQSLSSCRISGQDSLKDFVVMAEYPVPLYFTTKHHHEPYPFISPTRPGLSAAGKNVIITGGGSGAIGKAIALSFARAGASSVSIIGRRPEVLATTVEEINTAIAGAQTKTRVLSAAANLTSAEQATNAVNTLAAQVDGPIHVFVACAGHSPPPKPLLEHTGEEILDGISGNAVVTLHSLKACAALHASAAAAGTVTVEEPIFLHVSSVAAFNRIAPPPYPETPAYMVGKAAAHRLVDFFAARNPAWRVISFHPGLVHDGIPAKMGVPPEVCPDSGQLYLQGLGKTDVCSWMLTIT